MDFRKFQDIFDRSEKDFLSRNTPREWDTHLRSLGAQRNPFEIQNCGFILWSDSLRDWIRLPDDVSQKILVLGFIP